jgi:hypothetical protein
VAQLGFGWGKGRRVIKTIIAGEALTRALEKQQRFVDTAKDTSRTVVDSRSLRLQRARWRADKLRMAKASVHVDV